MKPLFVGLAASAVLAAGGASAVAAAETPSPSGSPSTSPSTSPSPTPSGSTSPQPTRLDIDVTPVQQKIEAGEKASLTSHIVAKGEKFEDVHIVGIRATPTGVKPDIRGECVEPFDSAGCVVGDIDEGDKEKVLSTLMVPAETEKTVKVTFEITVSAEGLEDDVVAKASVTFTPAEEETPPPTDEPTGEPTEEPTESPSPSPTPTPTSSGDDSDDSDDSSDSDDSDDSSGGGGSGSGSGSGSTSDSGSDDLSGGGGSTDLDVPDYPDPSPNSSFDVQSPEVAMPPIAAPSPSVAPVPATPQSRLRKNKAPVAQELTFERVASTQVAWLAALMVVFGLLLTQVRLGRRAAMAGGRSPKGLHRRTRRGMFGR